VLNEGTPVLGICLGMQLMTSGSEEGNERGLGWLNATTVRFDAAKTNERIRVPHMGWNTVEPLKPHPLAHDLDRDARFYFVHAFHLANATAADSLFRTHYGYPFVSGMAHKNICGVQFHPEKSHRFGMKLLKNFIERF
jgi:glutamine amidotransferase